MRIAVFSALLAGCAFGSGSPAAVDPANLPDVVTWNDHVGPMLTEYCIGCHGPDHAADDIDYSDWRGAACDFGELRESMFGDRSMPPGPARQPDAWDKATLLQWQQDGFPVSVDADGFPVFRQGGCGGQG